MTNEKTFTTGSLIQLNLEASAIHTIAILMEKADQPKMREQIEHMLLAYESIGLNSERISAEAYKIKQYFQRTKVPELVLIK